ncbi:MAG TPA: hypothetical protein VLA21_02490 [Candidatus Limnocylindria bacterium]|nr:hypothetical protein [Candidatus Limnocylindria bacterium]
MRKILVPAVLAILLVSFLSAAAQVPGDVMTIDDERLPGQVTEVLPLGDGMLVLGATERGEYGWMAFLEPDGGVRWALQERGLGAFRCASLLADGSFSALFRRKPIYDDKGNAYGRYGSGIVFVAADGTIQRTVPLAQDTRWLVRSDGGYYAMGTDYAGDPAAQAKPLLSLLDDTGVTVWSYVYENPDYTSMEFERGAPAGDGVVLAGGAVTPEGARVVLIQRFDRAGQGVWGAAAHALEETRVGDIAITAEGLTVGSYAGFSYGEDGFPSEREGYVYCLAPDGNQIWEILLSGGRQADCVLPMPGRYLVGSRGLNLEEDPNLGEGWLSWLDGNGNELETDVIPDAGGGALELMGVTADGAGKLLLYGVLLEEPGFPSLPFITRVPIPPAR